MPGGFRRLRCIRECGQLSGYPARETLCSWRSSSGTNITQSDGNVYQSGGGFLSPNINVGVGNGTLDNIGGFL